MSSIKSRTLTLKTLIDMGACYTYTELFKERFPEGSVEITVDLAVEQAEDWDWHFASGMLLDRTDWYNQSGDADRKYTASLKPYRELLSNARSEARGIYNAATEATWKLPWAEADELCRKATAAYDAAIEIPRLAFKAAQEVAGRELSKTYARVFAETYIAEGEAVGGASYDATPEEPEYDDSDYDDNEHTGCGCWYCN